MTIIAETPIAQAVTSAFLNQPNLADFNYYVVLDASGSMGSTDAGYTKTRWAGAQESIEALARELEVIDQDGLDIIVFNGLGIVHHANVTAAKVSEIFATTRTASTTPLAEALSKTFELHKRDTKKSFITVFTDGVPDDEAAVERVIIDQANSQATDDELTVLFTQVGTDASAGSYLKRLDDGLKAKGAKNDIVDTLTVKEAESYPSAAAMIIAAING